VTGESEGGDMADDRGENGDGGGEDEVVLRERPIVVTISGDGGSEDEVVLRERPIVVTISGDGSDENKVVLGVVKNSLKIISCYIYVLLPKMQLYSCSVSFVICISLSALSSYIICCS
jgi:hypothetical protein